MRDEKYYPSNTPNRQASMWASNSLLLWSDRTVIGSERTVEVNKLSSTSRSQAHYPDGVAPTIPAEGALTLPAGRGTDPAKSWLARDLLGNASTTARPGRP